MKFTELELTPALQEQLNKNNFTDCTEIQEASFADIVAGRDVAGLAQTGSGKTLAYAIPLIERIQRTVSEDQTHPDRIIEDWHKQNFILVLVPTRELAEQVNEHIKSVSSDLKVMPIYGGVPHSKQIAQLKQGVQFIAATPGRLIDLFKDHMVDLSQVKAVVFDEADRLFDMGFHDDVCYILDRIPRDRQFLVFSATLNLQVIELSYEYGAEPVEINKKVDGFKAEDVDDEILHIAKKDKSKILYSLIKKYDPKQVIVFTNLKRNVDSISHFLNINNIKAEAISSLINQDKRNRIIDKFKNTTDFKVLVCTDVAARGLDIKNVDLVINYDLPMDPSTYIHRIGRTGRAGEKGVAVSLVCELDVENLDRIESLIDGKLKIGWIEDEEILDPAKNMSSDRPQNRAFGHYSRRKDSRTQRPSKTSSGSRKKGDRRHRERDDNKDVAAKGEKKHYHRKKRDEDPKKQEASSKMTTHKTQEASSNSTTPKTEASRQKVHRDKTSGRHRKKRSDSQRVRSGKPKSKNYQRRSKNSQRSSAAMSAQKSSEAQSVGGKIAGFFKSIFK